jgi:D-aminopeptidase
MPSRDAIIHSIKIESIHTSSSKHVNALFDLIEHEQSPFTISKNGKVAIELLVKEAPHLASYVPFIKRSLSIRILQKCRNFYHNMKLSKL